MRSALRGLTTRGRCLIAAAVASAMASLLLGERELMHICALLLALPLVSAASVSRSNHRLSCVRHLDPTIVSAGDHTHVTVDIHNLSPARAEGVLLEDCLPYALGSRPRIVIDRLPGLGSTQVGYVVRAEVRGRYSIGPLLVRVTDPFGLCEVVRAFPATNHLTVVPTVVALPPIPLIGERATAGDRETRAITAHGENDAACREYRHGDDLRRVHWRSTAKTGQLMVRGEELPRRTRATLLLDTRLTAHRGEGPSASFEWAVSAVASLATHLAGDNIRVRLVTDGHDVSQERRIANHLADIEPSASATVAGLIGGLGRNGDPGILIAVLGLLTEEDADALAGARSRGTAGIALLIDSTSWREGRAAQGSQTHLPVAEAARRLAGAGWRTVPARYGANLSELWELAAAGRPPAGPATIPMTVGTQL